MKSELKAFSIPLKMYDEKTIREVLIYKRKIGTTKTVIYYIINSNTRFQVNLQQWFKDNLELPEDLKQKVEYIKNIKSNTDKIREIHNFVRKNLIYYSDKVIWNADEYWATIQETWTVRWNPVLKQYGRFADCENFAMIQYAIGVYVGVPEYLMEIVAGWVVDSYGKQVGHCYLLVRSEEDGLEYIMDGTYYPTMAHSMKHPYVTLKEYYYADKEWFRFNHLGSYKLYINKPKIG